MGKPLHLSNLHLSHSLHRSTANITLDPSLSPLSQGQVGIGVSNNLEVRVQPQITASTWTLCSPTQSRRVSKPSQQYNGTPSCILPMGTLHCQRPRRTPHLSWYSEYTATFYHYICLLGNVYLTNISPHFISSSLAEFKRRDPDFPIFAGRVLKLATKYKVDSVRQAVVKHLESDWPTDLPGWHSYHADKVKHIESICHNIHPNSAFSEPTSAIRVAMDHNIPSILPAAFYSLAQIDATDPWPSKQSPSIAARWDMLDSADLRFIRGKQALMFMMDMFTNIFSISGNRKCRAPRCASELDELKELYWTVHPDDLRFPDPLQRLNDYLTDLDDYGPLLCARCLGTVRSNALSQMETIRRRLPEIFRLESDMSTASPIEDSDLSK